MEEYEIEEPRTGGFEVGELGVENLWELIIKFHGPPERLKPYVSYLEILSNGYAIILLKEEKIKELIQNPQIEYVEMPKKLLSQEIDGRRASCILEVQQREQLTGRGILFGILDSGIDAYHSEFLDAQGRTRILGIWDQGETAMLQPPKGFATGAYYDQAAIQAALDQGRQHRPPFLTDETGHGTAVASIAAGSQIGVAREAQLLVVKLGRPVGNTYPRTSQLMRGIEFLTKKALELGLPIGINISYGNCYGDHQGTSLLERFLDNQCEIGRNIICVGSGNEGASSGHYEGKIEKGQVHTIELMVAPYESQLNLQLWKNYGDQLTFRLFSPEGQEIYFNGEEKGLRRVEFAETEVLFYFGQPSPYSVQQEWYLDFIPKKNFILPGIWRLQLEGKVIRAGGYQLYLPSMGVRNAGTGFYEASPNGTLTIPSTTERAITVGAYQAETNTYASFSGRGFACRGADCKGTWNEKPDLVAPGVGILGAEAGGGYGSFTGTSFATPYVTGSGILLMEWGIVKKNDPNMYGQKCKAALQRGARPFLGTEAGANNKTGWGALCLNSSIL